MREDREQSVKRKIRFRSPLETFIFIQEFLRKQSFLSPFVSQGRGCGGLGGRESYGNRCSEFQYGKYM